MIPFILVLVHTYMDSLRTEAKEADGEERSINHHGKTISVGCGNESPESVLKAFQVSPAPVVGRNAALIHRNEQMELELSKISIYLYSYNLSLG